MEDLRADTDRNTEYATEFLKAKCLDFTYIKLLLIIKSAIALASKMLIRLNADLMKFALNIAHLFLLRSLTVSYNIFLLLYKHYK